jgi:NTP pyrophosphatase (non-canonical NTP hydrolase)
MNDQQCTVEELRLIVQRFVDERDWNQFHNPKNLAMSLSIEASELMEHFQWLSLDESTERAESPSAREAICDEVADCLAYLLAMANSMQIDLATELSRKMKKNAIKYPVEQSRGLADPPNLTPDD